MILGWNQRAHGFAIGQGQDGYFPPFHKFFDHHAGASGAELAAKDGLHRLERLIQGHGHGYAFARRQTIGLHHDRGPGLLQIVAGGGQLRKGGGLGRGHTRFGHERLGPRFACFDLGPRLGGAKHGNLSPAQKVHNPDGQRCFGAHHHQGDPLGLGNAGDRFKISCSEGKVLATGIQGRSPISGNTKDPLHLFRLQQHVGDRVFTATIANH